MSTTSNILIGGVKTLFRKNIAPSIHKNMSISIRFRGKEVYGIEWCEIVIGWKEKVGVGTKRS